MAGTAHDPFVVRELSKKALAGNPDTEALIEVIAGIDRALAAKAIADAVAAPGDQEDIDKANEFLLEGDLERADGKVEKAVEL